MALADEIEAGFPPGTAIPADLRRLCAFAEPDEDHLAGYQILRPGGDALRTWFRGDETAARQFAAFAAHFPGSVLAFWLHAGPDAATAPVVALGPHPLHHTLLAADFRAFLHLIGAGYGDLVFDDLTTPAAELWNAFAPPEPLRDWLKAEFGITPPAAGAELVREARARHPDLGAWVSEWQKTAFPEPPAEPYRRELRDLVVAYIDFRRILEYPYPAENDQLRRDLFRVAEHVSDFRLKVRLPAEGPAQAVAAEVADDILGCVQRGEWDRLQPSESAFRAVNAWWYESGWLGRAWQCLRHWQGPPRRERVGPRR